MKFLQTTLLLLGLLSLSTHAMQIDFEDGEVYLVSLKEGYAPETFEAFTENIEAAGGDILHSWDTNMILLQIEGEDLDPFRNLQYLTFKDAREIGLVS